MIICGSATPQFTTLTGTFPGSPIVIVTAPNCAPIQVPTLLSASSTVITFNFAYPTCGIYEFVVTDSFGCSSASFALDLEPPAPPAPPPIPCITQSQALVALAARLEDPSNVHWTVAELTRYLNEALRTWNAYTQFYRNRDGFVSVPHTPFYDLPTVCPSTRGYNVTDIDLVTDILYTLMEPPTPGGWTGTEQFTLGDLVRCVNQARDQFLKETGAVLTHTVTAQTPAADGRISIDPSILTIRRAAWVMPDGVTVVPLTREDEWALTNYRPGWVAPTVYPTQTWPTGYSVAVSPPTVVQIAPIPNASGQLDLLTINLGQPIANPPAGVVLGIPDDWTWVVKFKALGDLLRQEGLAWDPQRAEYCLARWKHGVALASQASVVLDAQINGSPTKLYSVSDADKYRRTWQTMPKPPTAVLTDGQNIVGLASIPDTGPNSLNYTVTLDLVANMPIPINPNECLVITDANLEPILDYAQHIALTKEGPGILDQAMSLYASFERETRVALKLDQASVPHKGPIFLQTAQDTSVFPRTEPAEPTGSQENAPA